MVFLEFENLTMSLKFGKVAVILDRAIVFDGGRVLIISYY